MIQLDKSLHAWGSQDFRTILKQEIAQLGADHLPLHKALSSGNHVADEPVSVIINNIVEMESAIRVTAGIFYKGVMGGCSCADDPGPPGESNEYCEVQLDIDKVSAATKVTLCAE